ncbi:hypothetical protein E2542_SST24393 [Spatholobus suberectus]|nr:hypothetical protein E2542_SST24393 [Spatholobus suberectus]
MGISIRQKIKGRFTQELRSILVALLVVLRKDSTPAAVQRTSTYFCDIGAFAQTHCWSAEVGLICGTLVSGFHWLCREVVWPFVNMLRDDFQRQFQRRSGANL